MKSWFTDTVVNAKYPLFTRANAGEVAPAPLTPLGWTLLWQRGCTPGTVDAYFESGVFDPSESDGLDTIYGCFGGYLMLNLSILRRRAARAPGTSVTAMEQLLLGQHTGVPPYQPDPADDAPERQAEIGARLQRLLAVTELPQLDEDARLVRRIRSARGDLTEFTDHELVSRARDLASVVRQIYPRHVLMSTGAGAGDGMLRRACAAVGRADLAVGFISGIGGVDSVGPVRDLWEMSRRTRHAPIIDRTFESGGPAAVLDLLNRESGSDLDGFRGSWERYIAEYGYRGAAEWDPGADSWQTRPELLLALLNGLRRIDDDRAPDLSAESADHSALRAEFLAAEPDSETTELLDNGLRVSALYLAGRERSKTNLMIVVNEMRSAISELGRRHLADGAAVAMLRDDELDDFIAAPGSFDDEIRERSMRFGELRDLEPPYIVDTAPPPLSNWPVRAVTDTHPRAQRGDVLTGLAGSPGTVAGRARILRDSDDVDLLQSGDVLITPTTDPAWTPAFLIAAAVVVETGSVLSHAVIVSRELGTPSVISLAAATTRIRDGDRILVDGAHGTVTIL
ncbi:PEP-utilizing enzyme [Nocardia sp. CA-135953]|uniref:PEP-utilizing enzyme n=1 Tax=Nocardia sp. CA-135953 TaxID=3239978 RepID=UPI003D956D06